MIKFKLSVKIIVSLVLFTVLGISCADDVEPGEPSVAKDIMLGLSITSGVNSLNLSSGEDIVKSAYIFIYTTNGKLENVGDVFIEAPANGNLLDSDNKFTKAWKVASGTKNVYAILNPPASVKNAIGSVGISQDKVLEIATCATDYNSVFGASGTFQSEGGLITGYATMNVSPTNNTIEVPADRRYARIDLSVRKATDLTANVTVVGVKLKNYSTQAKLIETSPVWEASATGTAIDQQSLNIPVTSVTDYTSVGNSFYVMPRPKTVSAVGGDGSNVPVLEITANVGSKLQVYSAYLTELTAGACDVTKPLDIKGNYKYQVQATLTRKEEDLTINLTTLPWNKVADQPEIMHPGKYSITNSFIVTPGGSVTIPVSDIYKVWAWEYEDMIPVDQEVVPEIIWMDVDGLLQTGDVKLASSSLDKKDHAKIEVKTTAGKQGNALIGMRMSGESTYRWSWHIWITQEQPVALNIDGIISMDRNLGAMTNSFIDTNVHLLNGLFYQWGRKDPFPSTAIWFGRNDIPLYGKVTTITVIDATEEMNLYNSIHKPTTFYTSGVTSSTLDWYTVTGPQNDNLWGDKKTIYDPCPEGWKVPSNSPWSTWTVLEFPWDDRGSDCGRFWTATNTFYPASGGKSYASGKLGTTGANGSYWTSNINGINSQFLSFFMSGTSVDSAGKRANGYAIRCVKE